jgi:hypothetical protein
MERCVTILAAKVRICAVFQKDLGGRGVALKTGDTEGAIALRPRCIYIDSQFHQHGHHTRLTVSRRILKGPGILLVSPGRDIQQAEKGRLAIRAPCAEHQRCLSLVVTGLAVPSILDQELCCFQLAVGHCLMECGSAVCSSIRNLRRSYQRFQFRKIARSSCFEQLTLLCQAGDCDCPKNQPSAAVAV